MTPDPPRRIPVAGPSITEREIAYVTEAVATNWYENSGEFVDRFEAAFAAHLGRRHAVSLPSCTSGLHLALHALGVGPGDEVIVPDITWIASSAPVSYVGAELRFADVDPETWCIDVDSVERLLSPRTRVILPVDLYGGTADLGRLCALAAEHGSHVLEDSAEAIGSMRGRTPAGAFGIASAFSFHGSKTLTTGEGGMLVTDDDDLHARVRVLRDHGRAPGDVTFLNGEIAFKYKMSSLQAALGLAQLERLDELVDKKRAIFGWYADRLAGAGRLRLNAEPPGTLNSYWMITVLVGEDAGLDQDHLRAALGARGVDSRPFFHPLSSLPAYADAADTPRARKENEVSYRISPMGVNLPSALSLSEDDVDFVCAALLAILDGR